MDVKTEIWSAIMGYSQNVRHRHKKINNYGDKKGTEQTSKGAGKKKNKRQNPGQRDA